MCSELMMESSSIQDSGFSRYKLVAGFTIHYFECYYQNVINKFVIY